MTREEVGNLISYLRVKRNINTQKLCRGLCSTSMLAKIEEGSRFPDIFLLERILERLGKSANKIEFLYDEQSYEIYYLRDKIEQFLDKKEYEEVIGAIEYYKELKEVKEPLHQQYIYKIQSILQEEYYQNQYKSIEYLEEAIEQTMPHFILEDIEKYYLGEEEIILLLMWIDKKNRRENMDILEYRENLLNYIRCIFTDEEVLVNVYAKASWIFIREFIKAERLTEAASIGIHTIDILVENGLLLNLSQLLELLLFCYKKMNTEKYLELKKERDALKWIYETYGKEYETEKVNLWKNHRQIEIYLISEVIGQERKLLKETQEKIADEINIDYRTISRIERGKYKPKPGTFLKLKEYLEIDRDICSTHIVVEDFELLELERDIAREINFKRYEKAEELYIKLKSQLSLESNENRQYVMYTGAIFDELNHRISKEEAIKKCKEAFEITRKNCEIKDLSNIVLNKNETVIINYIARMYNELDKKKKSIRICEEVLKGFENSKVDLKYHYVSVSLLYESLAGKYEENNQFDNALDFYEKGIKVALQCEKGNSIGYCIMQQAYTMERRGDKKEACKYYYQQAYQLLKIMKRESSIKVLEKHYLETYKEDISKI